MRTSQLRTIYYAIKDGRDGNTVCTSWEDVRVASAETVSFIPLTPPPIAVPGSGGTKMHRFPRGPDPSQFTITGAGLRRCGLQILPLPSFCSTMAAQP